MFSARSLLGPCHPQSHEGPIHHGNAPATVTGTFFTATTPNAGPGGLDGCVSALRELSGGTSIIYKVLWLMEEGRGRKVAATASSDGSSTLPPKTHSSELFIKERGRRGGSGMLTEGTRKAGWCGKRDGAAVSEQLPG